MNKMTTKQQLRMLQSSFDKIVEEEFTDKTYPDMEIQLETVATIIFLESSNLEHAERLLKNLDKTLKDDSTTLLKRTLESIEIIKKQI